MVAIDDWDDVAILTMRFAGMLRAGLPPGRAWQLATAEAEPHIQEIFGGADLHNTATLAEALTSALTVHAESPGVFRRQGSAREQRRLRPWRELVAMIGLAEESGARLAATLDDLAAKAAMRADHHRQLQVLVESPRASGRVLMLMPVVGVLMGVALNAQIIGQGLNSAVGITGIACACVLMAGSWIWSARMLRALDDISIDDRFQLELLSLALAGPGSIESCFDRVNRVLADVLDEQMSETTRVQFSSSQRLAEASGMPIAALTRSTAEIVGNKQLRQLQQQSKALEVKLLFPLGLLGLPAFLIVTVVPFMAGLFVSTGSVF